MKQSIALIGPGRVGCAMSKRLFQAGHSITAIISRNHQRAEAACSYIGCDKTIASEQLEMAVTAQIILLAVPDDHIENVASTLQNSHHISQQTTLVHFSGLHSAKIMRHKTASAMLLSLHPLLPFADRKKAFNSLQQCPCAIEADCPQALALGEQLVTAIGGLSFPLESKNKSLYHAAASIASNYLVTLLASARDLLVSSGIELDKSIPLLLPLVQSTLDNVKDLGPEQGLSGPIVRGDIGTVADHIKALKKASPDLLELYLKMGKLTATLGQESGRLDPERAAEIKKLIDLQLPNNLNEKNN